MRQDDAYFGDQELVLVYIAKRLREAKDIENLFDQSAVDYLVEPDTYRGGVLFVRELIGAFFYVTEAEMETARSCVRAAKKKPYVPEGTVSQIYFCSASLTATDSFCVLSALGPNGDADRQHAAFGHLRHHHLEQVHADLAGSQPGVAHAGFDIAEAHRHRQHQRVLFPRGLTRLDARIDGAEADSGQRQGLTHTRRARGDALQGAGRQRVRLPSSSSASANCTSLMRSQGARMPGCTAFTVIGEARWQPNAVVTVTCRWPGANVVGSCARRRSPLTNTRGAA